MTSRRLVLIRHAQAQPGLSGPDADRPLTAQGRLDGRAVGRWLVEQRLAPSRVVVSPAVRTRQSWAGAAAELAAAGTPAPEPIIDERLYRNTPDDLLAVIGSTPEETEVLVVVGHNPSTHLVAASLAATGPDDGSGDEAGRRMLAVGYPTSGVAVFDVEQTVVGWGEFGRSATRLVAFAAPRG